MYKPNKINRNILAGIVIAILSVLLLIVFCYLSSTKITTNNVYAAEVFTFILGLMGLLTSIGLFVQKPNQNNRKS